MKICFGLFAIRRSDTTNDAMFDPDVCGARILCRAKACFMAKVQRGRVVLFIATNSVQRAEGDEVQLSSRTIFAKGKKEGSFFNEPLVAEMGFEPHDLRVMSPTSCQTAPLRDIIWCRKPGSNRYEIKSHGILSPGRLPIPPFRHMRPCVPTHCLTIIAL